MEQTQDLVMTLMSSKNMAMILSVSLLFRTKISHLSKPFLNPSQCTFNFKSLVIVLENITLVFSHKNIINFILSWELFTRLGDLFPFFQRIMSYVLDLSWYCTMLISTNVNLSQERPYPSPIFNRIIESFLEFLYQHTIPV